MKNMKSIYLKGGTIFAVLGLFSIILGSLFVPIRGVKADDVLLVSVAITASPSTICSGQSAHLTWSSTDATSLSVNQGIGSVSFFGDRDVSPSQTTTYTITGTNSTGGFGTASATVSVSTGGSCQGPTQNNPTVTLTANPSTINSGGNSQLNWTSTNATSCNASGGTNGWSGLKATSGSFNSGSLFNTTSYSITCTNSSGGSASDSATVVVNGSNTGQNPTVTISADDTRIDEGDSTRVRWSSNNANICNASGGRNGWAGSRGTSGTFETGSLRDDETYRISCSNNFGTAEDSVTVRVDSDNNNNNNDREPDVTTRPATNISNSSATLNGRVDGNGSTVRAWFEYGTNTGLGLSTVRNSYGSGQSDFSRSVSGLTNNTTYYFRAVAENSEDIVFGNILSFNTGGGFVNQPSQPTVILTADQTLLDFNGATFIRWNTTNATSCFASGGSAGWAGVKNIGPASFYTGSLTGTRTYSMTCSNSFGSSSDSVTVSVRGQTIINNPGPRAPASSLVLITSSVDRNQPIVPTLDNTRPHPGDEINYTVSYQNIGTGAITNLNLRIDLPLEVQYMFSTPSNPTIAGNTLFFSLGSLRANGQGTVTVRVRVRDNIAPGTNLNFPAVLSYTDPNGFPQSVTANVAAQIWTDPAASETVNLGANIFGAGFLPANLFGWLLLFILLLILILLAKYLLDQAYRPKATTTIYMPEEHK